VLRGRLSLAYAGGLMAPAPQPEIGQIFPGPR
jgi:hypothetical protein